MPVRGDRHGGRGDLTAVGLLSAEGESLGFEAPAARNAPTPFAEGPKQKNAAPKLWVMSDTDLVLSGLRPNSSKPNQSQTKPDQEKGLGFSWIPSSDSGLFNSMSYGRSKAKKCSSQ